MATVQGITRSDMIIPEFIAPQIKHEFEDKSVMLRFCDVNTQLAGNAGDKLTMLKYTYGDGKCQVLKEGDKIEYDKLKMSSSEIELQQYAKGYKIYDRALLATIGDPIGKMILATSAEITNRFDEDAIKIAKTTPLKFNVANATAITNVEINEALNLYGDKQNYKDIAGILINPRLKTSFFNMPDFVNKNMTTTNNKNGIIDGDIIGYWGGIIPVYISLIGTYDSAKNQCETLIIKKNSLQTVYKRDINLEIGRDIDYKCYKVNADLIAGIGLVNEAGIIHIGKSM